MLSVASKEMNAVKIAFESPGSCCYVAANRRAEVELFVVLS